MIWLQIFAVLLAQAIMGALFITYFDRKQLKSEPDAAPNSPEKEKKEKKVENEQADEIKVEQDTKVEKSMESAVGQSTFDYGKFKEMVREVMIPVVKECIAEAMDARECEFVESKKKAEEIPSARMTKEQEEAAFDDNRNDEELLQSQDDTPAVHNPLAGGSTFEEIATATVYLNQSGNPTPPQRKLILKVFSDVKGTQLEDILPQSMRERMYECHRDAAKNPDAFANKDAELDKEEAREKSESKSDETLSPKEKKTDDSVNTPPAQPPAKEPKSIKDTKPKSKSGKDEDAKPQRNFVPLSSFANPNKQN